MPDDFAPADSARDSGGNLLVDYQRPPEGLMVIAVVQAVIAVLWVAVIVKSRGGAGWAIVPLVIETTVFALSAVGLYLRRGWGWWITCTIYCYVFFNTPAALILWTFHRIEFKVIPYLVWFMVAILVIAYLNRSEVYRFVRFGSPDGRLSPRTRMTPVIVGLGVAVFTLIIELIH